MAHSQCIQSDQTKHDHDIQYLVFAFQNRGDLRLRVQDRTKMTQFQSTIKQSFRLLGKQIIYTYQNTRIASYELLKEIKPRLTNNSKIIIKQGSSINQCNSQDAIKHLLIFDQLNKSIVYNSNQDLFTFLCQNVSFKQHHQKLYQIKMSNKKMPKQKKQIISMQANIQIIRQFIKKHTKSTVFYLNFASGHAPIQQEPYLQCKQGVGLIKLEGTQRFRDQKKRQLLVGLTVRQIILLCLHEDQLQRPDIQSQIQPENYLLCMQHKIYSAQVIITAQMLNNDDLKEIYVLPKIQYNHYLQVKISNWLIVFESNTQSLEELKKQLKNQQIYIVSVKNEQEFMRFNFKFNYLLKNMIKNIGLLMSHKDFQSNENKIINEWKFNNHHMKIIVYDQAKNITIRQGNIKKTNYSYIGLDKMAQKIKKGGMNNIEQKIMNCNGDCSLI